MTESTLHSNTKAATSVAATRRPKSPQALLGGASPTARGDAKRDQTLVWLSRWGYTLPDILALRMELHRSAGVHLVDRMVRDGLVREIIGGGDFGYWKYRDVDGKRARTGPYVLMLTEYGKDRAAALDKMLGVPFTRQVSGIQSIRHNLLCQRVVAHIMRSNDQILDYIPEPAVRAASEKGQKEPDCILVTPEMKFALEIELTPKNNSAGALDRALHSVATGLIGKKFKWVRYLHPTEYQAQSYRSAWARGEIPLWHKVGSKWEPTGEVWVIPEDIRDQVSFKFEETLQRSC